MCGHRPAARAAPAPRRAFTTAPPTRAITAFKAKLVPIPTGCVIFTGAISTPDGYGRVTITMPNTDSGASKPVTVSAHRFAFWTHHGTLPDEGVLEHHCNEPLCVRIATDHVHASTQSANLIHAINSGRHHNSETVVDSARRADHSRAVRALVLEGFDAAVQDPHRPRQHRRDAPAVLKRLTPTTTKHELHNINRSHRDLTTIAAVAVGAS